MNLRKRSTILAWLFLALIAASVVVALIYDRSTRPAGDNPSAAELIFPLIPVLFTFVGALIISRQPRNPIGLLLLLPGLSLFILVDAYLRPFIVGLAPVPQDPSPVFLLVLWYSNWNWLLLVFPLMFIMVLFPTGRPLSRRWGWLIYFGLGLAAVIFLLATFGQSLAPGSGEADWSVPNPIGFLAEDRINTVILPPFLIALPIWVILCAASLFVRYRSAQEVERHQIKWLFYAAALFTLSYVPTFLGESFSDSQNFWNILWALGMLTIPLAIAIAILRYRLYDIDIIIRKTMQYSVVSALLALVYFGSVVLLQALFDTVITDSPGLIVLSTLLIAALFNPLRRRIQEVIDRRFYRRAYDAQLVLAQFAQTARDEVSLDTLTAELVSVVQKTIQPVHVQVWLRPPNEEKQS